MNKIIRFYFKKGRWHVTCDKRVVPAVDWWNAISQVKCMNHQIRTKKVQAGKDDSLRPV